MMDASASDHRQPSCQLWAIQNGWSTAEPPGPVGNPLPSFHQLNLEPLPQQTPSFNHLQSPRNDSKRDSAAFSATNSSYCSLQYMNGADQSVQQSSTDPLASSTVPATSQGRNTPPRSLPPLNEGLQHFGPQQMQFNPPHSPYQPLSPQFQPLHTYQGVLHAPQSPNESHLPVSPPVVGQHVNQRTQTVPQPASDWVNVGPSVGSDPHKLVSATSPIQQQPHWMHSAHPGGTFTHKHMDVDIIAYVSLIRTNVFISFSLNHFLDEVFIHKIPKKCSCSQSQITLICSLVLTNNRDDFFILSQN